MITDSTKRTIDRSSSVPIYKQIKEILISEIQAAAGETGRPISTEYELVERFNVSRAPVRQVLKELADEGYVYRERARGTFPIQELPVRPPGLELGGLVRFLREQGLDCTSKILSVDSVLSTEKIYAILGLKPSDKLPRISRLIFLQGKPLVWTKTCLYVSEDFQLSKREVEKVDSVFMLLEREQGIFISRGDNQICASSATSIEAELLDIKSGDPVSRNRNKVVHA
jgi:GntR family transcriptional regulator